MTFLRTDFETHAIWQGYVEEPAAKDFVAKKARTIALSEVQETAVIDKQRSTLFTSLEIPWEFLTQAVLRSLARPMSREKVELEGIRPTDIYTRNLRQKVERKKITGSESATRFPRASCFKKPTCSVPEIWGCMHNVLPQSAKGTRKRDKKLDSHAARKALRN
jgi:hypothetical protein